MKEQDIRKLLAGKLREFRNRSGLTAKEVGERIGKSEKTISGWEHGRGQPDADMLFLLCDIYEINNIAEFYNSETNDPSSAISSDEKELLSCYRSLNKQGKSMLLNTAHVFAGNPEMKEGPIQKSGIL